MWCSTNAVGFPQENIISVKRVVNGKDSTAEYEFDRVFLPTNNQVDVFTDTRDLVVSCMGMCAAVCPPSSALSLM